MKRNVLYRLIAAGALPAWAGLLMLGGCGVQSPFSGGGAAEPAPALPLIAAYEAEGGDRSVIFLELGTALEDRYAELADDLAGEFDVDVLPVESAFRGDLNLPALTPIDPETGSVGVSLTLEEMLPIEDGQYEATVRYARSGLDGGSVTFILEQQDTDWVIVERFYGERA
ncbi:MAG TPA: hypothetical protein VM243_17010 [Phycisphaerae bacterium]|nr:hypothetical protein [Phycisphaerae bacterium]